MANLMRTSNPALNEKAFKGQVAFGEAMTLQGTVNKTGLLLLCVVATAAWTWGLSHSPVPGAPIPWMMGGVFGGFIVALVTIFKPNWAPFTAPIYARSSKAWRWAASPPCSSAPTRASRYKPSASPSGRSS
ncbi:MAG TPA: Bax inhibitor-1/YccA family protein [Candidatus Acidoferrum sp.]